MLIDNMRDLRIAIAKKLIVVGKNICEGNTVAFINPSVSFTENFWHMVVDSASENYEAVELPATNKGCNGQA